MKRATPLEYCERCRLDAYEAVRQGDASLAHELMAKLENAARELGRREATPTKPQRAAHQNPHERSVARHRRRVG